MTGLLEAEPVLRLAGFFNVFALAELRAPWRRGRRWVANPGIVALDSLRVVFLAAAPWAEARGVGLMPALGAPGWLAVPLAVLLLDAAIHWQHWVFHPMPLPRGLYRTHHAHTGFDATTGLRLHPIEILLSMAIKIAVVVALGAPAVVVLVFEILLKSTALFGHGNLRLPAQVAPAPRRLLVTPEMHRVHHSAVKRETDRNLGFCLSAWDRLFGTHIRAPAAGPDGVTIGLATFRDAAEQRLDRLLAQPFRGRT